MTFASIEEFAVGMFTACALPVRIAAGNAGDPAQPALQAWEKPR